ncbi:class I SAM-dependent methyltransferase [Dactylosporangium vinaceum]|uniref:Class I SAM-dependent methyltransferase n=1 Tax=Dactylosporangium vinaceum TaxID=53362 RepID=A0ABV5MN70_9ACTN|nr:class I SAM-dependent methyltransferase [Dactylosporangium vinaceum]UAB92315.1 class I SAM-dependent methyltransferase [Dactylosporangium vinaceum]
MSERRGDYGYDGDFAVVPAWGQAAVLGALIVGSGVLAAVVSAWFGLASVGLALFGFFYVHTTRAGKFRAWDGILDGLGLRGDEELLDLGCGRGAVLLAAARRLPAGRAVGVDVWQADQTGNGPEVTLRNAELEGVAGRVEVHTCDITRLPFPDRSFDVVVSSFVIHNIAAAAGRQAAIDEAVRVLRPGGRLAVVDLLHTGTYVDRLRALGLSTAARRNLGWRCWWGGPFLASRVVTAGGSLPLGPA